MKHWNNTQFLDFYIEKNFNCILMEKIARAYLL